MSTKGGGKRERNRGSRGAICCQWGNAARYGQPNNWRGARSGRYFSSAATNKFNNIWNTKIYEI